MTWTLVEPGVAIVASSLVTIRPLLRQWRLKGFESSQHSRSLGGIGRRLGYGRGVSEIAGNQTKDNNRGITVVADDVNLRDLESGRGRKDSRGRGFSSRETTLTSRTSIHDGSKGVSIPNKAWGGTTVPEEKEDIDDDESDNVASPGGLAVISLQQPPSRLPWASSSVRSSSESVFVIQGAEGSNNERGGSEPVSPMIRGHVRAGKTVWTPALSAEESEGIQGLRFPSPGRDRSGGGGGLGFAL